MPENRKEKFNLSYESDGEMGNKENNSAQNGLPQEDDNNEKPKDFFNVTQSSE